MLNKIKKIIKNVSENRKFILEENEKIINIVERILYFNQPDQLGQGLKILRPNQMLSRLPISLAQLETGQGLKTDTLKTLYTNLVKEQGLKNNTAQKIMKKNC